MKAVRQWLAGLLVVLSVFSATAPAEDLPEIALFSPEQLEQLVAPIALYPDAMVAQILMAATYPLQVVQASRWRQRNPHLSGKDLDDAVMQEEWDPSGKSLLQFPDLLKRMDENLDWTQDLGDAMLIQQQDVMDTVQRMRGWAYASGNLHTTSQQTVAVERDVIGVAPANHVVYVPAYNPAVVWTTAAGRERSGAAASTGVFGRPGHPTNATQAGWTAPATLAA